MDLGMFFTALGALSGFILLIIGMAYGLSEGDVSKGTKTCLLAALAITMISIPIAVGLESGQKSCSSYTRSEYKKGTVPISCEAKK